ncbi:MAG: YkvA family protein [Anaerolineae bacterium]
MNEPRSGPDVKFLAAFMRQIGRNLQLIWRLFASPQVPVWIKSIPPLTILYLLFPVDLLPDIFPGLGQMDDLAILLLGAKLFIELSPADLVDRIRHELTYGHPLADDEVMDATYRVIDDE